MFQLSGEEARSWVRRNEGESHMKWEYDGYWISDDRNDVDLDVAHKFLTTAYWCRDIPREIVERAFDNSLCFSIFNGHAMVGFGRVVTDYATVFRPRLVLSAGR